MIDGAMNKFIRQSDNTMNKMLLELLPTGAVVVSLSEGLDASSARIRYCNSAIVRIVSQWQSTLMPRSTCPAAIHAIFKQKKLHSQPESDFSNECDLEQRQPAADLPAISLFEYAFSNDSRNHQDSEKTFGVYPDYPILTDPRLVQVSKRKVLFKGEICIIVFISDKTQEQRHREKHTRLNKTIKKLEFEKKELAREIEANSKFLSQVSNFVQTFNLQNMKAGTRPKLELIGLSATYLDLQLRDRIDMQAIEDGSFKLGYLPVDIGTHLKNLSDIVTHFVKPKRAKIKVQVDCMMPSQLRSFDRNRIDQILSNLLHNAIIYSDDQSEVLLKASFSRSNDSMSLSVTNQARAHLTPQSKELIFTKFYRTDQAEQVHPEGMGLGLYHSMEICKKMKGQLECDIASEFESRQSTTFTLSLPAQTQVLRKQNFLTQILVGKS